MIQDEPRPLPISVYVLALVAALLAPILLFPSLLRLFMNSAYMPHGHCYFWQPALVGLHGISDALIGLSYVAISAMLAYMAWKSRDDFPFRWMFLAFCIFIIACGMTHLLDVVTLWYPYYWLAGAVKLITALASIVTAIGLPFIVHSLTGRLEQLQQAMTSLRNKEEDLLLVTNSVPALIAFIDREERYFFHNQAYLRWIGVSVLGKTVREAVGEENYHHLRPYLERALAGEEVSLRYWAELPLIGRRFCQVTYLPRRTEQGREGLVSMVVDMTELKLAEEERTELLSREQRALQEAREASRIKDDFLATVSHELRTPLNAMVGWIQMLRLDELDAAMTRQALETLDRNARIQGQIIEDILDVSRIITGKFAIENQMVNLEHVLQAAIGTVLPAAQAKSIRLKLELQPVVPVRGDATRLQQIIWNLLTNALKFTPREGQVIIGLGMEASQVVLQIRDNGQGIDPAFLPHVFERFRQADSSSTRKHGGLGLGLAIVRHLVELHGGTVQAESPGRNQGASFTVRLPAQAVLLPAPGPDLPEAPRDRSLQGKRLLVVDDQADARMLLETILRQGGAEVCTASSVAEAIGELENFRPDLIVSDIGMPEQDGLVLIRYLRQHREFHDLPAIALTAYARSQDRIQVLEAGFQMHVTKPVEPSELRAVVASVLNRMKKPG